MNPAPIAGGVKDLAADSLQEQRKQPTGNQGERFADMRIAGQLSEFAGKPMSRNREAAVRSNGRDWLLGAISEQSAGVSAHTGGIPHAGKALVRPSGIA